jgi:O-antigen chain-terminating methyltransferase
MESHELSKGANKGTRRYFFGQGLLVKLFTLDNEEFHNINVEEHKNETSFLSIPPPYFAVPKLFLFGRHQRENWLVREQLPGELLLDLIMTSKPYDARLVIEDVLEQLTTLEAVGFYHDDLRVWNILIGADGHARLIDYGAITKHPRDRGWPYNIFLSFLLFMHEVVNKTVLIPNPIRPTSFNPMNFHEAYRPILWKLLASDPSEWRFTTLYDSFIQSRPNGLSLSVNYGSFSTIVQIMEEAHRIYQDSVRYWRHRVPSSDT